MASNSHSYLIDTVKRNRADDFLIALFAPKEHRYAILSLFAFYHEISKTKEVVSEPMMGKIRLQWWWDGIQSLYDENISTVQHDVLDGLTPFVEVVGKELFEGLIEEQEKQLEEQPELTLVYVENQIKHSDVVLFHMISKLLDISSLSPELAMGWGLARKLYKGGVMGGDLPVASIHDQALSYLDKARALQPKQKNYLFLYDRLARLYLKEVKRSEFKLCEHHLKKRPNFTEIKIAFYGLTQRF